MSKVRPVGTVYEVVTTCLDPESGKSVDVIMKYKVMSHWLYEDGAIERVEPIGPPEPANNSITDDDDPNEFGERSDAIDIERMGQLKEVAYTQIMYCNDRSKHLNEIGNLNAACQETRLILELMDAYLHLRSNELHGDDEDYD